MIYVDFSNIPISNMPTSARQWVKWQRKKKSVVLKKAAADAAERKRQKRVMRSSGRRRPIENAEKYEADLKSQAKENKFNRKLSIASFVVAVISLFISFFNELCPAFRFRRFAGLSLSMGFTSLCTPRFCGKIKKSGRTCKMECRKSCKSNHKLAVES